MCSIFTEMWYLVYSSPKVTACAINGHALAGGAVLATAADYRLVRKLHSKKWFDTRKPLNCRVMVQGEPRPFTMGFNETRFGLVVPQWSLDNIADVMGFRLGERHLLLGSSLRSHDSLSNELDHNTITFLVQS